MCYNFQHFNCEKRGSCGLPRGKHVSVRHVTFQVSLVTSVRYFPGDRQPVGMYDSDQNIIGLVALFILGSLADVSIPLQVYRG